MAKYKVVKEISFGSGYTHDKNGKSIPIQNFAPKVGEIIELGEVETFTTPPYAPKKGFKFNPNPIDVGNGFQVIPFESVEKTDGLINGEESSSETFLQKHKNHLLIIGALVLGYLLYNKYKK